MQSNAELLQSIADLVRVSAPSHVTNLLREAGAEIARLNSEVAKLQAQVAVQKRRVALSAEERRCLVVGLRLGTKLDAVELPRTKVGKLVEKLEAGRR
jgi:hypothetical protein